MTSYDGTENHNYIEYLLILQTAHSDSSFNYLNCFVEQKLKNSNLILAQIGSELPIFTKIGFWENWLLLLSTNCILSCYNMLLLLSRSLQRANHETKDCIILAQIGCELLPWKRIFYKSWPTLPWSNYTIVYIIMPCHFKKLPQSRSRE